MNVQELIDKLQKIEDKTKKVIFTERDISHVENIEENFNRVILSDYH